MLRRAPVSALMRRCPSVTIPKMVSATALPIEATAERSKTTTTMMTATARMISPNGARPPSRRAISVGNWPDAARWSDRPVAGYSPELVAPAVANSAVTVISQ